MDWTQLVGPLVGFAGVIAAAWFGFRGTRRTDKTAGLDSAAKWWEAAVKRLDADVEHLKEDRATLRKEFGELKKDNAALAAENRLFREVLGGVLTRAQQMPPFTPTDIIDYIREHLPMLGRDKTNE